MQSITNKKVKQVLAMDSKFFFFRMFKNNWKCSQIGLHELWTALEFLSFKLFLRFISLGAMVFVQWCHSILLVIDKHIMLWFLVCCNNVIHHVTVIFHWNQLIQILSRSMKFPNRRQSTRNLTIEGHREVDV